MTNQQILEKAIATAIEGGWTSSGVLWNEGNFPQEFPRINSVNTMPSNAWKLIYDHDFAKALWGDKFINPEMRDDKGSRVIAMQQTAWRHHLRQMVTAEEPIKYLGDNI